MSPVLSHNLRTDTAALLTRIADLKSDLADLHGYHRAPHPAGLLDRVDPSDGTRMTLNSVVIRIEREHREGRREQPQHEVAGEHDESGGGHALTISPSAPARPVTP